MTKENIKKKYFVAGFDFIAKALEKYYSEQYAFKYETLAPGTFGLPKNYWLIKKKIRSEELSKYDVVHLGAWETILAYKKIRKDQIFIAHAHGFIAGLSYDKLIWSLPFVKRQLAKIQDFLMGKKMKKQIRSADIFYVSTPNLLEYAKKIRKDAIWLPNSIDVSKFNPKGEKKKLEGTPSVLFLTRFHAFKNPLYGVLLFNKILKKYPDARLHVINYGSGMDPLFKSFKKKFLKKGTFIEHKLMPHEELAKMFRGADLVLGQFNEAFGSLTLLELEAMATGAPVVTQAKYELNIPLNKCESLAFKLIEDKKFRSKYIKENIDYVRKVHSEEVVAKLHEKNIKNLIKKI